MQEVKPLNLLNINLSSEIPGYLFVKFDLNSFYVRLL